MKNGSKTTVNLITICLEPRRKTLKETYFKIDWRLKVNVIHFRPFELILY